MNSEKRSRMYRVGLVFAFLAVFAGAASRRGFAQSTTEGAIGGTVTDQTKAVVPGATVTAKNTATNTTTTHRHGRERPLHGHPAEPRHLHRRRQPQRIHPVQPGRHHRRSRARHEHGRHDQRRRPGGVGERRGPGARHQPRVVRPVDEHQSDVHREPARQRKALVELRAEHARRRARRHVRPDQLPRHFRTAQQQHRGRRRQHAGVLRRRARPHAPELLVEPRRRAGIPGHDFELLRRIRARRGRRRQRRDQERRQQDSGRRVLLHPRQQVGRAEPVHDDDHASRRRLPDGAVQARRSAEPVRRQHRRAPQAEQAVLLLQLRPAEARFPGRCRAEQRERVLRAAERRRTGHAGGPGRHARPPATTAWRSCRA